MYANYVREMIIVCTREAQLITHIYYSRHDLLWRNIDLLPVWRDPVLFIHFILSWQCPTLYIFIIPCEGLITF